MQNHHFANLYQKTQKKYQELQEKSNQISILRFCLGIGIIITPLIGYFENVYWLYGIALLCLIVFLISIHFHNQIKSNLKYHESLAYVYQRHHLRKNGQWDDFGDDGHEFYKDDAKAMDLDVVGHHSLFQMINLSFTHLGAQKLAETLMTSSLDMNKISLQQDAVKDMSEHSDFVIELETYGHMIEKNKEKYIQKFIESIHHFISEKITSLIFIVTFLTVGSLFCLCFSIGHPYSQIIFEVGAVLQLCFALLYLGKHNQLFEPVAQLNKSIQSYLKIFETIERETFSSYLLKTVQTNICQKGKVVQGIKELSKISQRINYRKNIFVMILLNALGLYDFWLSNQYLTWLETYHNDIQLWFDGLAQIETWMSLSVLKIDEEDVCMPQIVQKKTLSFKDLRHPLIHRDKVIGNDFTMSESVCVITGSNMSGKTTFMRTIGLNLILAYAGGFVFAKEMTCSYMYILTSMRVKDNVEEGISTFYGELLRIKEMIQYSKQQLPMLCLIDEIFKGTNSLDRIAGAKATIQKLSLPHIMTFLTTHDFELCQQDDLKYLNYHFDESYEDNRLCFDYLIKAGQSQSTNGQFLLKQLGIME